MPKMRSTPSFSNAATSRSEPLVISDHSNDYPWDFTPVLTRLRGFAGLSRVASLIINGLAEKVFTTARSFRSGWWR
jgi:hypothetical protein